MPATVLPHFHARSARPPGPITPFEPRKRLVAAVAREFSLAVSALDCATSGAPDAALARQAAMYLAHVVFALSFAAVGRIFGRDRTTVAHACSVIENLRDDPRFDARMTALENICRTIGGAE